MYHAGTDLGAYVDTNFQDGVHMRMADAAIAPEDGRVRRILDTGTSIGQFATSMKRRYPDAEVWGIDVGGPMVRYAHMKAVDMGVDVNFAQRLSEDSGFSDNYFDIVTSNLLFHEVTKQATSDIIQETYRVLRPGGVFSPTDANDALTTAHAKFTFWYNYRWNHEDWFLDWMQVDFPGEMRKAGFKVIEVATQRGLVPRYVGIKT
jgi:ubiquinone/menaquinone biosynthesis C-methylase UbiE